MIKFTKVFSHKAKEGGTSLGEFGKLEVELDAKDGKPVLRFDGHAISERLVEEFLWGACNRFGAHAQGKTSAKEATKALGKAIAEWISDKYSPRGEGASGMPEVDVLMVRKFADLTGFKFPRGKTDLDTNERNAKLMEMWLAAQDGKDEKAKKLAGYAKDWAGKELLRKEAEAAEAAALRAELGLAL